jgi:hypothetical protein
MVRLTALSRSLALIGGCLLMAQSASAQSILRDAETEALFHDMTVPLIKAAGLDPKNVDIVLVNDPEINAFVAGAGGLCQFGHDQRRQQRQRGAGRDRARAGPRGGRPCHR